MNLAIYLTIIQIVILYQQYQPFEMVILFILSYLLPLSY